MDDCLFKHTTSRYTDGLDSSAVGIFSFLDDDFVFVDSLR